MTEHGQDPTGESTCRQSSEETLSQYYDCFRALARRHFRDERAGHTLQPTALATDAYLTLKAELGDRLPSQRTLLGFASRRMGQLLVDHARQRKAQKRGGDACRITLDEAGVAESGVWFDLIDLNEALAELAEYDAALARVVELRYFAGFTDQEIADEFGHRREWANKKLSKATKWLYTRMADAN